jgi:hypothetical protein
MIRKQSGNVNQVFGTEINDVMVIGTESPHALATTKSFGGWKSEKSLRCTFMTLLIIRRSDSLGNSGINEAKNTLLNWRVQSKISKSESSQQTKMCIVQKLPHSAATCRELATHSK